MKDTAARQTSKKSATANGSPSNSRPYPRLAQDFSGESKTQQSFLAASNVNAIVDHFVATGHDPRAEHALDTKFGYASSQTFHEAISAIAEINSAFELLPATKRAEFSNDSSLWLDSLGTPEPLPEEITPPRASPEPETEVDTPESAEIDST